MLQLHSDLDSNMIEGHQVKVTWECWDWSAVQQLFKGRIDEWCHYQHGLHVTECKSVVFQGDRERRTCRSIGGKRAWMWEGRRGTYTRFSASKELLRGDGLGVAEALLGDIWGGLCWSLCLPASARPRISRHVPTWSDKLSTPLPRLDNPVSKHSTARAES